MTPAGHAGGDPAGDRRAYAAIMGAMAAWGLNVVMIKYLAGEMDAALVPALRILVALSFVSLVVRRTLGRWPAVTRSQLAWLALAGALAVYGHQMALTMGLQLSSAVNASLFLSTSPLLSLLLAAAFYRERLGPARLAGAALGLCGIAVLVLGGQRHDLGLAGWGDVVLFIAVLVFVCGGLVIQRAARSLDPLTILWYMYMAGGVMLVLHALGSPSVYAAQAWPQRPQAWLVLAGSGVVALGWGNIVWNRGIARLGLGNAGVFLNWVPIFGLASAVVFLGETVTHWHALGLACVLVGTWLGLRRR